MKVKILIKILNVLLLSSLSVAVNSEADVSSDEANTIRIRKEYPCLMCLGHLDTKWGSLMSAQKEFDGIYNKPDKGRDLLFILNANLFNYVIKVMNTLDNNKTNFNEEAKGEIWKNCQNIAREILGYTAFCFYEYTCFCEYTNQLNTFPNKDLVYKWTIDALYTGQIFLQGFLVIEKHRLLNCANTSNRRYQ